LLLNVVLRPDGSLDPQVEAMLRQLADWTAVNGEAIYGTRPWLLYGEGVVKAKGGAFNENFQYSAKDIRFTTKGQTLYAIALGWPADNQVTIRSLANLAVVDPNQANHAEPIRQADVNRIESVELLGYPEKLAFTQSTNGLVVELPVPKGGEMTCALKITGHDLLPMGTDQAIVVPDSKNRLIFSADDAVLHGGNLKLEERGGKPDIGYWDKSDEWVSWSAQNVKPGAYFVSLVTATLANDASCVLDIGGQSFNVAPPASGGWDKFSTTSLGRLEIKQAGKLVVTLRPANPRNWRAINLNSLRLIPAAQ